jgi:hypothetical protein
MPSRATGKSPFVGSVPTAKLAEALAFLQNVLARGPRPARVIPQEASSAGIAPRTLVRARDAVHLIATHQGWTADGYWVWRLPETADAAQKDAISWPGVLLWHR